MVRNCQGRKTLTKALYDSAFWRIHSYDATGNGQQGSDGGFKPGDTSRFVEVVDGKVYDATSIRY